MIERLSLNQDKIPNQRIGIMGGTFDPIHYGHLFIAETALDTFKLDKILFIPTGKPPHKKNKVITNGNKRMDMVNLAIESNPRFEASYMEVSRENISYTIDTIMELKKDYGDDTEFYFITGTDAFIQIETWKEYKKLLSLVKFIVMTRKVLNSETLDVKIQNLSKEHNTHISKVQIPTLEISSTNIRKRIKEGKSIKYLLPENVEQYILNSRLYTE